MYCFIAVFCVIKYLWTRKVSKSHVDNNIKSSCYAMKSQFHQSIILQNKKSALNYSV